MTFIRMQQRKKEDLEALFERYPDIKKPEGNVTKAILIAALEKGGVSNEALQFEELPSDDYEVPEELTLENNNNEVEDEPEQVCVAMTRLNPSFSYGPYKFTQEKKYVVMSEEDAENLMANNEGFRLATKREVQKYYS